MRHEPGGVVSGGVVSGGVVSGGVVSGAWFLGRGFWGRVLMDWHVLLMPGLRSGKTLVLHARCVASEALRNEMAIRCKKTKWNRAT